MNPNEHEYGTAKYVRLDSGEFRFASIYQNHVSLIKENENPVSAGLIAWDMETMRLLSDSYSMTLRIGPSDNDEQMIADILGFKVKPRHSDI